jgi:hypothetical protein
LQETDVSYGRLPDGTGPFSALPAATPGMPNSTDTAREPGQPPLAFTLAPAYPNPFSTGTTVGITLPHAGHVTVGVYDVLGRRVRRLADEAFPPGAYRLAWDGLDDAGLPAPSGVYFIRLQAAATGTLTAQVVRMR